MATPYAIVELESAESTQDEARARADGTTPVLVIAGRQRSGRGRLGRQWVEPDRGLFSSFAFQPVWPTSTWARIPLVAGLALREAVAQLCGLNVGLRWPNDLMSEAGKVGGVLVESGTGVALVGCGVNLLWADPVDGAAALFESGSDTVSPRDLATVWVDRFLERMSRSASAWGIDEYRRACVTIGRVVSYESGSGVASDISDDGALLVESADGLVAIRSGEVRLHGPATIPDDRRGT